MDMEMMKLGFQVGQFLLTAGLGFYVHIINKNSVTNDRITKLETDLGARITALDTDVDKRLDNHSQRITAVEVAVKHAPTHEDLGKIYEQITATRGEISKTASGVAGLEKGFVGLENNVRLITDFLINGGKQQ